MTNDVVISVTIGIEPMFMPQRFADQRYRYVQPTVNAFEFPLFKKYSNRDMHIVTGDDEKYTKGEWFSIEVPNHLPLNIMYENTVALWMAVRKKTGKSHKFKFMFQSADDCAYFRLMMP